MRDLRLETVADDVVAWHNRHPLARRIGVEHVHSIGYVVLPFVPLVVAGDGAAGAGASDAAGSAIPATRVDPSGLTPPGMVTLTDVVQAAVAGDALTPDPPQAPQPRQAPQPPRPKLRDRAVARARQLAGQGVSPPATEPGAAPVQADAAAALAGAGAWPAKALRAIFSEAFFEHASVKQVARWASRHGRQTLARLNGPTRVVPEDPGLLAAFKGSDQHPAAGLPLQLVLRTATIESGSVRLRLLLGPGAAPAVLGPRWWSGPRLLGSGLASVAVLGFAVALQRGALPDVHLAKPHEAVAPGQQTPPPQAPEPTQASADTAPTERAAGLTQQALPQTWAVPGDAAASGIQASNPSVVVADANEAAASAVSAPGPSPTLTTGSATSASVASVASVASAASAAPVALAASAAFAAPIDVEPQLGQVNLPSLGPFFDQPAVAASRAKRLAVQTQARQTQIATAAATQEPQAVGAAAAAAAAAGVSNPGKPDSPSATDSAATAAVNAAAAAKVPATGPVTVPATSPATSPPVVPKFALSTRLLRTPAETEQLAAAMRTLLTQQGLPAVQVEIIPVGADWRVVGWPFVERSSADKARGFLASRGMRVEVIDF